jgi:hypothetical protein
LKAQVLDFTLNAENYTYKIEEEGLKNEWGLTNGKHQLVEANVRNPAGAGHVADLCRLCHRGIRR